MSLAATRTGTVWMDGIAAAGAGAGLEVNRKNSAAAANTTPRTRLMIDLRIFYSMPKPAGLVLHTPSAIPAPYVAGASVPAIPALPFSSASVVVDVVSRLLHPLGDGAAEAFRALEHVGGDAEGRDEHDRAERNPLDRRQTA